MKKTMVVFFVLAFIVGSGICFGDQTGINLLPARTVTALDNVTRAYYNTVSSAQIGVVIDGKIVFTKSYRTNNVNVVKEWASISKPATAMIVMQLIREGYIDSLDDNIWVYSHDSNADDSTSDYSRCLPSYYNEMSIRRVLRHMAGLPGPNPANIWTSFPNGTLRITSSRYGRYSYSTTGFSIVGDVIEDATNMTYQQLVHRYLRDQNPLYPHTLTTRYAVRADYRQPYTNLSWQTPSSYVRSSILDLAKFAAGEMLGYYITEAEEEEMYQQRIGWMQNYTTYGGQSFPCLYHTGDNGTANRAVCIIDRTNDIAVVILYSGSSTSIREAWAKNLMNVIYSN